MSRLDKARELRSQIEANLTATRSMIRIDELTESELAYMINLYDEYKIGKEYAYPDIFRHEGKLYQVREGFAHTSQADWIPSENPTLYRPIQPNNVVAEWDFDRDLAANPIQPGERVIWTDGKVYESIHPTPHAWSPSDYPQAWRLIE